MEGSIVKARTGKFITARHRRIARGFSLVEMMVAITIGLIILAAVSAVFVSSKRSYSTQDRLARLQENARFAIQFLTRDIRMAGYSGCAKDITNVNNTLNNSASFVYSAQIPIEGIENAASTWSPSGSSSSGLTNMKSNTDAIAIRLADTSQIEQVTQVMQSETDVINVASAANLPTDSIVMVSDCSNADVFQVTSNASSALAHATGGASPGNSTQTLSKLYDTAAQVMNFHTRVYYVQNRSDGTPALYMQDNGGTSQELVEGVESLQITYGVDTDADGVPNVYLTAGAAGLSSTADWAKVKSVRIGILVRTPNDKDIDPDIRSSYDVNGYTFNVTPGDRYQRRVFVTTIRVRNM
jgi:type IV pilus assembly protein PilW